MRLTDIIDSIFKSPNINEIKITREKNSFNIVVSPSHSVNCQDIDTGFLSLHEKLRYDPAPCTIYNYMKFIITCHNAMYEKPYPDFNIPTVDELWASNIEFVYSPTFIAQTKQYIVKTHTYELDHNVVYSDYKWLYSIAVIDNKLEIRGVLHEDV